MPSFQMNKIIGHCGGEGWGGRMSKSNKSYILVHDCANKKLYNI